MDTPGGPKGLLGVLSKQLTPVANVQEVLCDPSLSIRKTSRKDRIRRNNAGRVSRTINNHY
jgi:hypothetical protein